MFDLSHFIGKSYFDDDESQNCFIFNPVFKYFEIWNDTIDKNLRWKTKFLSEESMKTS